MDESFKSAILSHIQHVLKVGEHCTTEETTKQALILPLLEILGFSPFDPTKVKAEFGADFPGAKAGERVDYALFCNNIPVMYIEAKAWSESLTNHAPQLSRYFNSTPEVAVAAITNGKEWRFFTDLKQKNIMDDSPFLRFKIDEVDNAVVSQLKQFCHDRFQPEALRTLAEENVYLTAFVKTITSSLRDVDSEFVRYVASRSNIGRQLNQKFLDSITPIVKEAVSNSISEMVVSGLSSRISEQEEIIEAEPVAEYDEAAPIVDAENSKIITTYAERQVLDNVKLILNDDENIVAKDTESYFNILYQGKNNRWIIRFFDRKQRPSIALPIELTTERVSEINRAGLEVASNQIIIDRPENILRISGIIMDCYEFSKNDENFKKKK